MFKIHALNKISPKGIDIFSKDMYELTDNLDISDAILVRSQNILEMNFSKKLKAIARAGAGVNNIPIEKCTESGIVVFNTPGANANAVKELAILSILLASRNIHLGINWTQTLVSSDGNIPSIVEKGKSQFIGPEIKGKRLGVVGLGAIGVIVANDAVSLGMDVIGYDPFISIEAAWELSSTVHKASSLEQLFTTSDYITIHVPYNDLTKNLVNKEKINLMKRSAILVNLSRGGLVDNEAIIHAVENSNISKYITDFPDASLIGKNNIITIPHLGASTPESEENCAQMAVRQLINFLENGNIKNSVNFPNCDLPRNGGTRVVLAHDNIPNMFGQITSKIAEYKININDMLSRSKGNLGYTILDITGAISSDVVTSLINIPNVKMVRIIE
jgi:D-3-phosphoglycerate dehydrogenase / 2-oxoglutarate reductase